MANSSIPITDAAESTQDIDGFSLDDGNFRPAVVIGDPTTANAGATVSTTHGLRVNPGAQSRADTYTGTGNGTAVDASTGVKQWFGLQVKGTGAAATSWTVVLQASLDGANYATILTHSNASDSDGSIVWISTPAPALHFRSSVSAVSLGAASNIVVTIVGMP
jgi:hypothetical protein